MSIAQVEKIYDNEKEIKEYNNFREQILKEKNAIKQIFKNDKLPKLIQKSYTLALESVFGMLNELTPEQIKLFEESVKRRPCFR